MNGELASIETPWWRLGGDYAMRGVYMLSFSLTLTGFQISLLLLDFLSYLFD